MASVELRASIPWTWRDSTQLLDHDDQGSNRRPSPLGRPGQLMVQSDATTASFAEVRDDDDDGDVLAVAFARARDAKERARGGAAP